MTRRETEITRFLKQAGWAKAERSPVPGDASTRRYERLVLNGKHAVLMDAPKGEESPAEPEGASIEDRKKLGYNAIARLAGPNIEAFACLANELHIRGFSAPDIYAADLDAGILLLEDFGRSVYAKVITDTPSSEQQIYEAAIDTLAAIYRASFPEVMTYRAAKWRIRHYDQTALTAEADLFLDWYAKDLNRAVTDKARQAWYGIWQEAFTALEVHASGLALRDFHAENLFWLPEREGCANVGLIDFQDALFVHPAYDLVSFIEDARRDVSAELSEPLQMKFCDKAGINYDNSFKAAYSVMGAQRNAKILGIFVRLAERDGKPHYRQLIPRVKAHFQNNLNHSHLAPLKDWIAAHVPEALA